MDHLFNNPDLFPTPQHVIELMCESINAEGKIILEPSAGTGNIIDYLNGKGAKQVLYCETSERLQKILEGKGKFICPDFLNVTSDQISHIEAIVMNPPFSDGVKHVLHAYNTAPEGCKIVTLLNASNLENTYTNSRKELASIINSYGNVQKLGNCFNQSERSTNVDIVLLTIIKPGQSYKSEFEGFFMEEEAEEQESGGIMPYNVVRDLVNRYVAAVKIFDEQLEAAVKMNELTSGFYSTQMGMSMTNENKPIQRNEFKKEMQKSGWKYIFNKLDLTKDVTRGVRETINKFVEEQTNIPFTMRNIYRMLEIIVATRSQTMDKALVEVFDKITQHHDENRYNVEGWKTNSHFLVGKKFILPGMCYQDQRRNKGIKIECGYGGNFDLMEDMVKALCYITADSYNEFGSLSGHIRENPMNCIYGEWFEWSYFRCKAFKKGSMHFEFKDLELWGKFNQRIAKIKGFPLFEYKTQTKYQNRNTGRKEPVSSKPTEKAKVLFTVKLK